MKRMLIYVAAAAAVLAALVVAVGVFVGRSPHSPTPDRAPTETGHRASEPDLEPPAEGMVDASGFLYGRVTTLEGATYEGRLRWGGGEEAFWDQYFNGRKESNPWTAHVSPASLRVRRPIKIFGFEIAHRMRQLDLDRPFMVRFGDIARIDVNGRDLRVTLKSGGAFELDRFGADDLADGLRVWDASRGIVDLDEWRIRSVEFFPTAPLHAVPSRLHGTVRTRHGDFTGFVQWNRDSCVGTDLLVGVSQDGEGTGAEVQLRLDTLRSIARETPDSSRVTLLDGREVVLTGKPDVGKGHRGVIVQDPRVGRVSISWDAFERVEFSAGETVSGETVSGPAYDDFLPGHPITGQVIARDGRRLAGRLVYDLDESESTETLDVPSQGLDYSIPFDRIDTISTEGIATVTLHSGDQLFLEHAGDLGDQNAGLLIFVDGQKQPEYVSWTDVEHIDFDPPAVEVKEASNELDSGDA